MKFCLWLVWGFAFFASASGNALDREAFTFTRYQLEVQIDRNAHVMAVTGKVTLRNGSNNPQKVIALQVTSSFRWNSITLDDRPLQWLGETYTSDIDRAGNLTEAIITLPSNVAPGSTVTLAVQYGGTITPEATRLTRMGTPADLAARTEWDEISESFTAVRGLGYVVWYPVAIEAVSMSDGNAVFDAIAAWKHRHVRSDFTARIVILGGESESLCIATNASPSNCGESKPAGDSGSGGKVKEFSNTLTLDGMEAIIPAFAVADYVELSRPTTTVLHVPEHTQLARDYALAAEANDPLLKDWLGELRQAPRVIELTESTALPYQSGSTLFAPLRPWPTDSLQLLLIPTQVSSRFQAAHPWIEDGLQRFMQAVSVETRSGRKEALDYLDDLSEPLAKAEQALHPVGESSSRAGSNAADNTLLNTHDELYLRGKGSFVLWMLRDMVGNTAMQAALTKYRPGADKDPGYLQRLIQTSSKRDLEWFFDDWVYRDRGLPEFRIDSAYARPLLGDGGKSFLANATIENRGRAGAEVPVIVHTPSGEKVVRVLVKAGEKATGRVEVPAAPDKVIVNDGSVPTAGTGNNVYEMPAQKP